MRFIFVTLLVCVAVCNANDVAETTTTSTPPSSNTPAADPEHKEDSTPEKPEPEPAGESTTVEVETTTKALERGRCPQGYNQVSEGECDYSCRSKANSTRTSWDLSLDLVKYGEPCKHTYKNGTSVDGICEAFTIWQAWFFWPAYACVPLGEEI